ncbi:UPF0149 family protein [Litoribrevibacter albus]|uniref:Uncharacterized protein n=1 Tax=Litoribrevibacter albus TaxID=1473156 RepID=A0AA37SCV7_9GAMM|nr:UPF0149 family protein [Litoribrevibacter albus]GLQ33129.1 hypothetical protein GCM10007876_36080 [Litoribrevibacter albus]
MAIQEQPTHTLEQLFEDLADSFLELKIQQEPSEVHGVLVGMLVQSDKKSVDDWLALLDMIDLDTAQIDERTQSIMQEIYQITREGLASDQYDFQLLMPADDYEVGERANALAVWASGFITGYGLAAEHKRDLSVEMVELLNHLHAISELDDQLSDSEENEKDLYELYEYVRLGVLMLRQAMQGDTGAAVEPSSEGKTLH